MRKLIAIYIIILASQPSFSQKWKLTRYEAMVGIASANYFGDIGGSATPNNWFGVKDISLLGTRPSFLAAARYKITQKVSVKANFALIMLGGSDRGSLNEKNRPPSGFSFNSYGFEHIAQMEYSVITEDRKRHSFALFGRRGMGGNYSKKNIYGFLGFGGLLMYPAFNGTPTPIDIVHEKFLYTLVIPGGIGVKVIYNNKYAVNVEFGARYSFSDFLDGVTSTSSHFNDVYYFTSFNIVYRIKTSRKGYPILFKRY